jgi:UDP-2,3-diacylglucosamine pyrophosphatase LpxH
MSIHNDFIRDNRRISIISNGGQPFKIPEPWRPLLTNCTMLVVIPDMHMYVRSSTLDNFKFGAEAMLSFLDHLGALKEDLERHNQVLRIYQIGDLYEQRFPVPFSRAPNVTAEEITMSDPQYSQIVDALTRLRTQFIYGNHDFEMRHLPHFRFAEREGKIYLEHGFTPDQWFSFANPRAALWEPGNFIFKGIREVEHFFGKLMVDAKVIGKDEHFALGVTSGEQERAEYPSPKKYPQRQLEYYTKRLRHGANGPDVRVSIIGHTHHPYFNAAIDDGSYLYIDAGCWTSGRSDFVVVTNEEIAICHYHRQEISAPIISSESNIHLGRPICFDQKMGNYSAYSGSTFVVLCLMLAIQRTKPIRSQSILTM